MRKSFNEIAENIFYSVLLLPCEEYVSAEETQNDFLEKIKEFCNDSANCGYSASEIENAKYALCAWIDEYIYTNTALSSQWFSHSLVLNEFEDAEAGARFFEKIETFHKNKNSAPLLELYAKCILFGFMGKFRIGSPSELKQILNSAVSKTGLSLEEINYKPATKNKHRFSFRRGVKNILLTGSCVDKCKDAAKKQRPPKGYKYMYSDMKNIEELPFIDGVVSINPLGSAEDADDSVSMRKLFSKQKCKVPVYSVADLEIQEFAQTIDKNYEFNSNHLNYYLREHFLDFEACKKILALPKKLEQFKNTEAFYSLPFFGFMKNEKPLAYSLSKKVFFISLLAMLALSILFLVFSVVNARKEEIKTQAMLVLQKKKLDSIKAAEDSINKARRDSIKAMNDSIKLANDSIKAFEDSLQLDFENRMKNLELTYQKQVLEKFPFKEGKIPPVAEVMEYFRKDGDFYKFLDIIDTVSDSKIKFNKKALSALLRLKNSPWSDIPVSMSVKAPRIASVSFGLDGQFVEIERGGSKNIELLFPRKNGGGIEFSAKTANNTFKESISGEWSLLKIGDRRDFSFMDKSYSVDVEISVQWHLPPNAIKPGDWFSLRLEPNLIQNFSLTKNLGE